MHLENDLTFQNSHLNPFKFFRYDENKRFERFLTQSLEREKKRLIDKVEQMNKLKR